MEEAYERYISFLVLHVVLAVVQGMARLPFRICVDIIWRGVDTVAVCVPARLESIWLAYTVAL